MKVAWLLAAMLIAGFSPSAHAQIPLPPLEARVTDLTGTESKIAYARQYYNDQVRLLNTAIQSFPSSILASTFHFTAREFFDIEDAARGPVQVTFEGS